jgi:hypothetical protein
MGARDVRAGGAYVEVSTKDNTDKGLRGIASKVSSLSSKIKMIGGLATGGAAAAAAATVLKAVDTGAAINDLSERYGIHTDAIQSLGYAAEQAGTDINTLVLGIKSMQKGIGNGTIADELAKIGIKLSDLAGKSPEQQLAMIADAFSNLSTQEQKMAAATAIFGKSGADMLPMLTAGAGGFAAMDAELRKIGPMSAEAVAQAAALDNELVKLKTQFNALVVSIGSAVIPAVSGLVQVLSAIPGKISGLIPGTMGSGQISQQFLQAQAAAANNGPVTGTGNSPLANWLRQAQARSAALNQNAAARAAMPGATGGIMDIFKEWGRIGRSVERQQNKDRIRENRALLAREAEIQADMKKMRSFGGFDKEGMLGGIFGGDIQKDQLKELKEIRRQIEANGRRQFAIPGV